MTILAFDGKILAADRRSTTSWGSHDSVTKIWRHGDFLCGISGKPAISLRMFEWWKAGQVPADFPAEAAKEEEGTFIAISGAGVFQFTTGPYPVKIETAYPTWGGGRDFASAAMHCGRNAYEAVELTCLLSVFCGNGIDTLTLPSK